MLRRGVTACLAAVVLLLSGCGAAAPTTTAASPAATSSTAAQRDFAGTFDVGGGRRMFLQCAGTGSPRVVFISGQRGSAQEWSTTAKGVTAEPVFQQVARHTRVCAYDRPGTPYDGGFSRSDPAAQPTTAAAMADDLGTLLRSAGEKGPTVIVAHSAGGLAGLLYAETHPTSVDGLVLVDATSTGLRAAETPQEWQIQLGLLAGDLTESLKEYPDIERIDFDTSMDQVLAGPPLRQLPLVVISADHPWGPVVKRLSAEGQFAGVPSDFGYVVDRAAAAGQAELAGLVKGSVHITETDSGHDVHQEQPTLVSRQVLLVVDRVRAGKDSARG